MEHTSYLSGGKSIGLSYHASAEASQPAILLLHGAGGVDAGHNYVQQLAASLSVGGYATYILEYFDRTDTTYASHSVIQENFALWLRTIADAVSFIADQPHIDPARIGTLGYSLGGALAVAHAAEDLRVRATVELAGTLEPEQASQLLRLPPLLIIHGEQDRRVPFSRAVELERLAWSLGGLVETAYYPDERHVLSSVATLQAFTRALLFFDRHLV